MTRQLEEDLPWTQRVSISWRFSLQRRQHQLLYNAFLPIVIVLVLVIILSIVGWKLLSLISAGSANSNIRDLRAVIPALGALTVIVLGYQQVTGTAVVADLTMVRLFCHLILTGLCAIH